MNYKIREYLKTHSDYPWFEFRGSLRIITPKDYSIEISQSSRGFDVTTDVIFEKTTNYRMNLKFLDAIYIAESWIRELPYEEHLKLKNANWRKVKASSKQIEFLHCLDADFDEDITKGDAEILITYSLLEKKYKEKKDREKKCIEKIEREEEEYIEKMERKEEYIEKTCKKSVA